MFLGGICQCVGNLVGADVVPLRELSAASVMHVSLSEKFIGYWDDL